MATLTCSLCRKSFESGPEHCPFCHMRVPGTVSRKPAPTRRTTSAGGGRLARSSSSASSPATPLQCPACAHAITRDDEWCRWCKWPVNRRE